MNYSYPHYQQPASLLNRGRGLTTLRKIRYDYYNVLSASCHQFGAIVRPSFNKTDVGVQMPMIFSYDCVFGVVRYMSETGILLQRPP